MNGLQLYDHLQQMQNMRGIPVVLISGVPSLPFEELHKRGIYLLRKPFEMDDLLDLLAQLLPDS